MYPGLANAIRALRMFIRKLRTENCLKKKNFSPIPQNFILNT